MLSRIVAIAAVVALFEGCGSTPGGPTVPGATATPTGPGASSTAGANDSLTLIQFADTSDPGAAARREQELMGVMRDESGMAALIGSNGQAAFDALDAIENAYARELIADIAAAIDAGLIPTDTTSLTAGTIASRSGAFKAIDVSLFADTGFTASALMQLYAGVVQLATTSGSGTLPRQESFDQTSNGLRQQVDLATTTSVTSGGGHVSADITMSATDRITDADTGSFIALYTSRTTGHFDVNACPDDMGVGEGTYTFETKHELNDVSSPTAARSGSGRSVTGPFQLVNGPDAHLQRIDAQLDLEADSFGPGSPGGPGPTAPFNWNANQQSNISMPANGPTTATGTGINISGTGGEGAGGSMFLSSAMAQLFLAEVAKEAEKLWRSGECIEIKTTVESRDVTPGEAVDFQATSVSKIDGNDVDAPIKGTFSGKDKLDPDGQAQDPPVNFTFTAGSDPDDTGTIQLEQVGVRGIGKKKLEFTVKSSDFKVINSADHGLHGVKCDGLGGTWTLDYGGQIPGTTTFTLTSDGGSGAAHTDLFADLGSGATAHYVLDGSASVVKPPAQPDQPDPPYALNWVIGSGTLTVTSPEGSDTVPISFPAEYYELEQGDFCE